MSPPRNLRQFIATLRTHNEVVDITCLVDPYLEIAEIHRRVAAQNGPALFFHNVKGSPFPVVTNLFGSLKRVQSAFPHRPEELIARLLRLATQTPLPSWKTLWKERKLLKKLSTLGTKTRGGAPVLEQAQTPIDLNTLPFLQLWPKDGGHFLTLPLVYTEAPGHKTPNLGMYRIQRYTPDTCGLHFQIQKGGGFHHHLAEKQNAPLPVTIFLGGPPALILSAIAPLPENVSELLLAGWLQGEKLHITPRSSSVVHPLIAECEFALHGFAPPHVRKPEGPFGDHYGYYSLQHDFPVFQCTHLFHRKDAIYPATVVGKPRQEDFYIGDYLQELLSPLFPIVMPTVRSLWSYGETGFHSLSAAVVHERYYREAMLSAFRILGEGQLSLTKFLLLTDQSVDLKNFPQTLTAILERFRPETDLFIFANLSLDTLDYTGPSLNKGSRGVLLGVGDPVRTLPTAYHAGPLAGVRALGVFSPGCLVVQVEQDLSLPDLLKDARLDTWPLVVVVDSVAETLKDTAAFLWTVFTRFEPAADIYARRVTVARCHLCYTGPIAIDARMKPSYPPEVECAPETAALVSRRWPEYFSRTSNLLDKLCN